MHLSLCGLPKGLIQMVSMPSGCKQRMFHTNEYNTIERIHLLRLNPAPRHIAEHKATEQASNNNNNNTSAAIVNDADARRSLAYRWHEFVCHAHRAHIGGNSTIPLFVYPTNALFRRVWYNTLLCICHSNQPAAQMCALRKCRRASRWKMCRISLSSFIRRVADIVGFSHLKGMYQSDGDSSVCSAVESRRSRAINRCRHRGSAFQCYVSLCKFCFNLISPAWSSGHG